MKSYCNWILTQRYSVINAMKAMLSEDVIGPSDGAVLARIRDFATRHVNDYGPAKILLDNIVSIFESVDDHVT